MQNPVSSQPPSGGRPIVLVVDDQPQMRRLLEATLSGCAQVRLASDGAQALACLEREPPDVMLLDVMMPGEPDGLQLLARLRRDPVHARLPVALISARAQASDRATGLEHGADAYFVKPFSPAEIRAWVVQALAGKSS